MDEAVDILARTLWGEARGEGVVGMAAVAAVVRNRCAKGGWWGSGIKGICLKPKQFSCWNEGDPNRERLPKLGDGDAFFMAAKVVAELAVAGALADITAGATHYHASRVKPSWARGRQPCCSIGNHLFYNDI